MFYWYGDYFRGLGSVGKIFEWLVEFENLKCKNFGIEIINCICEMVFICFVCRLLEDVLNEFDFV